MRGDVGWGRDPREARERSRGPTDRGGLARILGKNGRKEGGGSAARSCRQGLNEESVGFGMELKRRLVSRWKAA